MSELCLHCNRVQPSISKDRPWGAVFYCAVCGRECDRVYNDLEDEDYAIIEEQTDAES